MSAETLESIKQQIPKLTYQEKLDLLVYVLRRRKERNPEQAPEIEQEIAEARDLQRVWWMKTHRAEYGGQYIVLDGDQLLGTRKSYAEARELAQASGKSDLFVNYLPRPDEGGYLGG